MTHRAVGFGRGFPRAWLLPIGALTIILGVAASGRLSRSIVADLLAWWPIWLGLAITAYLLRERRLGNLRAAGLVPIIALYQVEPIKRGGRVGIPDAVETVADTMVTVALEAPPNPGLYSYAGWDVRLSLGPVWSLDLRGAIDADLTALALDEVEVSGAGTVQLGEATVETLVDVGGSFQMTIPAGTAARVVGTARVPSSWTLTQDGASSPGGGNGWVFTVVGDATLTIVER